jgi:uncharacterized protein with HEPN domain
MKANRLVQDYLRDILDAMDKAEKFVSGIDHHEFIDDDKTVYAVIRSLEMIGEAAKKIPSNLRRLYTDIPWKSLSGMRDKLIHDYMGVSTEVVWRTVKEDIPLVYPMISKMLEAIQAEENADQSKK